MSAENSENEIQEDENQSEEEEIIKSTVSKTKNLAQIYENKNFELGNGNLHFLPMKISYTGYCRVSSFFDPLIEKRNINSNCKINNIEEAEHYTGSFRGRLLNGKKKK